MQREFLAQTAEGKPPKPRDLKALRDHVRQMIKPTLEPFQMGPETLVFGSSGTFETLAEILVARNGKEGMGVNGFTFSVATLAELLDELSQMTPARRSKVPGLDIKRADIIVAGMVVLHTTLELLGAKEVTVSQGALREGMLHEYLSEQQRWTQGLPARQRSVLEMAQRFGANLAHARQVTLLCQNLYDRLTTLELLEKAVENPQNPLEDTSRSLLSAAVTLHEIGLLVDQSSHHKHSSYLIRNGGLLGYNPSQIDLIAQIARYHRKSPPKPSHPEFAALSPVQQKIVGQLAAILRVADGLDRSHTQQAHILELSRQPQGLCLRVKGIHSLEQEGVAQKGDLWAQVFGPLILEVVE
jgi:exopolyphosphatase / guanosine-5'-triphosphate,3'-diphosphate pyrophosphatase